MSIRVLHAPTAVGGHPIGLAAAERELGLESTVVTIDEPPYGYRVDRVLAPPGTSVVLREWRRWAEARRAGRDADVVHFNFGSTLAPAEYGRGARRGASGLAFDAYARLVEQRDLRLLKRAGRAVFVTFQGDDVRPGGGADDLAKRRRAARFERHADRLYVLNPDLLEHVAGAEFLPYASVDPRTWTPVPASASGPLRVVHAPSDRARKGTEAVLGAVERARANGADLELELVEGASREDARRALERADVVVDQLVMGWYGSVAVEAMALGKTVVARLERADLARVPAAMREELPVVEADGRSLERVLSELAGGRRGDVAELGRRGRAFVERWHDPLEIARRVVADYERALSAAGREP
jgi:hypothetical protein